MTSISGALEFSDELKTESSERTMTMSPFVTNLLAAHLESIPEDPDQLIFTDRRGGPIRHDNFRNRVFTPAVRRSLPADVQGLRWHDLRHTCASLLIGAGANILLISKVLGHSKPSMTLDVYGHLFPSQEAACAVAIQGMIEADSAGPDTATADPGRLREAS